MHNKCAIVAVKINKMIINKANKQTKPSMFCHTSPCPGMWPCALGPSRDNRTIKGSLIMGKVWKINHIRKSFCSITFCRFGFFQK